jgi:DNA-binding Xre family transcriptional regulator
MVLMRFLLPELMTARGIPTAYALAKASHGAIPITTANRLVVAKHRPKRIDMETLEALCAVLDVEPGELFERESPKAEPPKAKRARRR